MPCTHGTKFKQKKSDVKKKIQKNNSAGAICANNKKL